MQFILFVGWRLLFSQHSFQEFTFLWSCSNCSNDWEGTVPSAWLTASRTPSQGRFVFHGCSGLGAEVEIAQKLQEGKREEPVSWESWGFMLDEKKILAAQMEWAWARGKSSLQLKEDVTSRWKSSNWEFRRAGTKWRDRAWVVGDATPCSDWPWGGGEGGSSSSSKVSWGRHTGAVPGRQAEGRSRGIHLDLNPADTCFLFITSICSLNGSPEIHPPHPQEWFPGVCGSREWLQDLNIHT